MSSNLGPEIRAILRKELLSERRDKSASYTAGMLSAATVFTLAFAFFGRKLTPEGASGALWAALLFAGVGTLARAFIAEEEQGTGDLLRLWARPAVVFWGKSLFAFIQMTITSVLVSVMFLVLTGTALSDPLLLCTGLLGGSAAFAGLITVVSALISRGSNRGTLAGVVALPLMLPLAALGVNAARGALDPLSAKIGWGGALGVWCYAALIFSMAPYQFEAIWREHRGS